MERGPGAKQTQQSDSSSSVLASNYFHLRRRNKSECALLEASGCGAGELSFAIKMQIHDTVQHETESALEKTACALYTTVFIILFKIQKKNSRLLIPMYTF